MKPTDKIKEEIKKDWLVDSGYQEYGDKTDKVINRTIDLAIQKTAQQIFADIEKTIKELKTYNEINHKLTLESGIFILTKLNKKLKKKWCEK